VLSTPYEIDEPRIAGKRLKINTARTENPVEKILNELLSEDMVQFMETLEVALRPQMNYLTETELSIYRRGKKIRPIMLMLSARLITGKGPLSHKVIKAATSLEMLHVATLIHDDIIDNALLRRGLQSVNATRGVNTAILVGDMQFVQAIRCFIDAIESESEMGHVKLVLDTAFRICAGELDELNTNPNWETAILREKYFEVIERKTAIMFGLACETGTALMEGRTSEARRIGFYGRRVGRAFQIMDDLFDCLQNESDSGKIRGTDLAQKRLSLPIIYAMEELGDGHLLSKMIRGNVPVTREILAEAQEAMNNTHAFERAYADARHEALDALEYLKPFKRNRYYDALEQIALYTVDRDF
jgi:heptaprenyl diphosphate synthase